MATARRFIAYFLSSPLNKFPKMNATMAGT
jgi:hypothetical protein